MNLKGSTFIVTGGGSGLGEATVRMIVDNGGNALIMDIKKENGERVAADLGKACVFAETDVTNSDQVQAAIDTAIGEFGGLHGVVNCAGVGMASRVVTKQGPHPLDVFEMVVKINLIGTFNVIRLAATVMAGAQPNEEGERGVIVNTASVAAFDGQVGQSAYSASKGGIVGMTLPIARDLASLGIRCNTIAPGIFETPLAMMMPDEVKESLAAQVPFPSRFGRPEEFASLVRQLVENPMMNGETIRIDGAIRMAPR